MTNDLDLNDGQGAQIERRSIVKGAAWALPVVATAIAVPTVAASEECTLPPEIRNSGTWLVDGPKNQGTGYVGWRTVSGINRYYYQPNSNLYFTWTWTPTPGETGQLLAGTKFYVGIGGQDTFDHFFIANAGRPVQNVSDAYLRYVTSYDGTTMNGPRHEFEVVQDFTPSGPIVFNGGWYRLGSEVPATVDIPRSFGAHARVEEKTVNDCPPLVGNALIGSEWTPTPGAPTTGVPTTYSIVSQSGLDTPGYYNPGQP